MLVLSFDALTLLQPVCRFASWPFCGCVAVPNARVALLLVTRMTVTVRVTVRVMVRVTVRVMVTDFLRFLRFLRGLALCALRTCTCAEKKSSIPHHLVLSRKLTKLPKSTILRFSKLPFPFSLFRPISCFVLREQNRTEQNGRQRVPPLGIQQHGSSSRPTFTATAAAAASATAHCSPLLATGIGIRIGLDEAEAVGCAASGNGRKSSLGGRVSSAHCTSQQRETLRRRSR